MESLAIKKKRLDIQRVETAAMDLDVKCHELSEEIERLKSHIQISKESLSRLNEELEEMLTAQ